MSQGITYELGVKWRQFMADWTPKHTVGQIQITPGFSDFMDWLSTNSKEEV